ncbi:uncharacterized protein LOC142356000 [Convolutriloba macropyga]|uniref:uncharacterized protein LOC142356000 n=1 Tax=Convolutriloba macropyga TaxID=536237 RepID=UPI003F51D0EC
MDADFGEIKRVDMNKDAIKDFSVPPAVVAQLTKPGQKRVLAVVTKVYVVSNPATVTLQKEFISSKGFLMSTLLLVQRLPKNNPAKLQWSLDKWWLTVYKSVILTLKQILSHSLLTRSQYQSMTHRQT